MLKPSPQLKSEPALQTDFLNSVAAYGVAYCGGGDGTKSPRREARAASDRESSPHVNFCIKIRPHVPGYNVNGNRLLQKLGFPLDRVRVCDYFLEKSISPLFKPNN